MNDEMITQVFQGAGFLLWIPCLKAYALTGKTPAYPAEPDRYRTQHAIGLPCNQPGCFL